MVPKTIQFSCLLIYHREYADYNYFNTLVILEFVTQYCITIKIIPVKITTT